MLTESAGLDAAVQGQHLPDPVPARDDPAVAGERQLRDATLMLTGSARLGAAVEVQHLHDPVPTGRDDPAVAGERQLRDGSRAVGAVPQPFRNSPE